LEHHKLSAWDDSIQGKGKLDLRLICATEPVISETRREYEADFWLRFDAALPAILGALLTAVSGALAALPSVRFSERPRMADLAKQPAAPMRSHVDPDKVKYVHRQEHIDIGLFDPTPQRVPAATNLRGNRHNRRRLIGILVFMFKNHPNRARALQSKTCLLCYFFPWAPSILTLEPPANWGRFIVVYAAYKSPE
jgi:hypothetical protein